MSIFGEMIKKYNEELDRLAYNVAFINACELLREIAKKVAQNKVVTDNLLDGMYITFYDELEKDARWMYVGYIEGDDDNGLDIMKGINIADLEIGSFDTVGEIMSYIEAIKDETSFSYENTYAIIEEQIIIAINAIKEEINEYEG